VGDFLLDFRPSKHRALTRVAEAFLFAEDSKTSVVDRPGFGLVVTHTGDSALWEPFCVPDGSLTAIAGRVVLDESEWNRSRRIPGKGGLAAQVIQSGYQELGVDTLEHINGNCAVIVYDSPGRVLHLVTDPCGVFPVFVHESSEGPIYCSHPDVLAGAGNEHRRVDELSIAEFVLSGTVTPPFTYYERVRAAEHGTIVSVDVGARPARSSQRRYFTFSYRGAEQVSEDELAHQLGAAVRRAVQRRTLPRLGRSVVALSGGLDSRVVLACTADRERTLAFSCYDEPNRELRTAEMIARSLSVPLLPLRRDVDYYAEHAERGVRISGGMGSLANNHFLGVIPRLKSEGMENLLTGCYCDYLFKGLPLNRGSHWLTGQEQLAPFRHQFYFQHFGVCTPLAARARERWEARIPLEHRAQDTVASVFEVEARRTFPLCYEGDNQQRVVPQRVTGWCPPFLDRDVIDVYCRLPYAFKFNRSLFRKVVVALAPELRSIPDSNTSAPADASRLGEWVRSKPLWLKRKINRLRRHTVSDESWPNWPQYVRRSEKLEALWKRPNPDAMDIFRRILGPAQFPQDVHTLQRDQPFLFVSLLTLKLWLDQQK
jgi:asparagine synthase (glutamine-hydrolysing)